MDIIMNSLSFRDDDDDNGNNVDAVKTPNIIGTLIERHLLSYPLFIDGIGGKSIHCLLNNLISFFYIFSSSFLMLRCAWKETKQRNSANKAASQNRQLRGWSFYGINAVTCPNFVALTPLSEQFSSFKLLLTCKSPCTSARCRWNVSFWLPIYVFYIQFNILICQLWFVVVVSVLITGL